MTQLNQSLELSLKLKLNLLLKQSLELLTLPAQELEQILSEEALSNPFIKDFVIRAPETFFCKEPCRFEIPYTPSELEELEKNIKVELSDEEIPVAEELLKHIDEKGFLVTSPEEISRQKGIPLEFLERVRKKVMSLHPEGVASLNLKEFLEIQIEELYPEEKEKLKKALIDLSSGKPVPEEVRRKLSRLKLHPLSGASVNYKIFRVDAVIEEEEGKLIPYLYDEYIEIDLSEEYVELYRKAKGETKRFLKESYERYKELVKALNLRKQNLKRVLEIVAEVQKDFLLGKGSLKSFPLSELANELGVHISTVSRLVNSKYVKTPVGTFLLKHFFPRESVSGISQDELMELIREIIENEDKSKPYSDEEIARMLRRKGYDVARRTVAKYRQLLGIPSSRERKNRYKSLL